MKRVTIFDYGAGNLHSLAKALDVAGVELRVESDPASATETDALVLPGVGAFASAAGRIAPGRTAMREAILRGLPTPGICLGMQLLFAESEEGPGAGLGVIPGRVRRLRARRVPQIGWNGVEQTEYRDTALMGSNETLAETPDGTVPGTRHTMHAPLPRISYFANSYVCEPDARETIIAYTTHETDRFASAVSVANTVGVQFHPEKSSTAGVEFVHHFVRGILHGDPR